MVMMFSGCIFCSTTSAVLAFCLLGAGLKKHCHRIPFVLVEIHTISWLGGAQTQWQKHRDTQLPKLSSTFRFCVAAKRKAGRALAPQPGPVP
jgi:hypothetical protein